MSKENLSQRVLLEVLTHEIETLKAATKIVNRVVPAVDRKLSEVKQMRITANVNLDQINQMNTNFKRFLDQLDKKLPSRILFPKWLVISLLILFFSFAVSVGYNFIQKEEIKANESTVRYYYNKAVELGYNPETDN